MRRVAVENLRDVSQPTLFQVIEQRLQQGANRLRASGTRIIDPHRGVAVWPDQPRPDGALVIGAVSLPAVAPVFSDVLVMSWRERAQPVRRQQMFRDHLEHRPLPLRGQGRERQADRKDLVGADRGIVQVFPHHVIEIIAFGKPKHLVKTPYHALGQAIQAGGRLVIGGQVSLQLGQHL